MRRIGSVLAMLVVAVGCGGTDPLVVDGGGDHDAADVPDDAEVPTGPIAAYVADNDDEIHMFAFDPDTLAMTPMGTVAAAAGPSWIAFDPQKRWLVVANESASMVESFRIGPATGTLTRVNAASAQGNGPAHVAIDATGAWVLVSTYGGGTAATRAIAADGTIGAVADEEEPGANAHQLVLDAANDVAYVPCLGDDRIATYGFDVGTGALTARTPANAANGAGPRHLAIAPDGAHAWVMNELTSSVTTYAIGAGGVLTAGATVSSLPSGFGGNNTGAEIAVHPSGQWVYASNRGHDSIAVFEVGAQGALTLVANTPTGGDRPRHFSLVPGGRAMLVANQDSGTIHGFRIDPQTGLLTAVGELAQVSSAVFVEAIVLPGD